MTTISNLKGEEILYVLKKARSRIEDSAHWCQNTNARDKFGMPISSQSEEAAMFCMQGAFVREVYSTNLKTPGIMGEVLEYVKTKYPMGATWFNDMHTHEEVITFLDGLIQGLEGELAECRTVIIPIQS